MSEKKTYYVVKSDRGKKAFLSADLAHRAFPLESIHFVKRVNAFDKIRACASV